MFLAKVIGSVWATVKWPEMEGIKLLTVQPYNLSDLTTPDEERLPSCADLVVCADMLDAGVGDEVVVAYGHAARVALEEFLGPSDKAGHPVDAAVVAIVDQLEVNDEAANCS